MKKDGIAVVTVGSAIALAVFAACAKVGDGAKGTSSQNSESSISTNENGSVSRCFTESTVTTNGNMVTEHRRETRTNMDTDGNVLETSTSEYSQSYPVGDSGMTPLSSMKDSGAVAGAGADSSSFMGVRFGEVIEGTNFVADADEPTLLRTTFKPKKPLAGFDDYYVYVTPTTHKAVKIYACAKKAVEPGANWRRHYIIEALEKRYRTWARPRSWCRPIYTFDIGSGRFVTACLNDATCDYGTVVAAWDDSLLTVAADETEALREAARKAASAKRSRRVADAAEAF